MRTKVFVSWSGNDGEIIATALKNTILNYASLEPFVSKQDIGAGRSWRQELEAALRVAQHAVGVLTPGAAVKPWVNFEAGMLYGRLRRFIPLRIGPAPDGPIGDLQCLDGNNKEDVIRLLVQLTAGDDRRERDEANATAWVESQFGSWTKAVEKVTPHGDALSLAFHDLANLSRVVQENAAVRTNRLFHDLIAVSVNRMAADLGTIERGHEISAVHYPYYLLQLQTKFKARVRAIALVDRQEHFWPLALGMRLADSAAPQTKRVFVFDEATQFKDNYSALVKHAEHYGVFAMSRDNLAKLIPGRVKDFSIIEADNHRLLAEYGVATTVTTIRFSPNKQEIQAHERMFDEIVAQATRISGDPVGDQSSVFGPMLAPYESRQIEMSAYVSIGDYDAHEEEHAYYREMMDKMIAIVRSHIGEKQACRVLELGAGTGIFTRRLASALPNVEIVALEYDWVCYQRLRDNVRTLGARVEAVHADSRRYNPPGRFACVVSSFADHHIKSLDKPLYFANVKRNLDDGGLFIVGDEFLRQHDSRDVAERESALFAYHGHIIEIAEKKGQHVLAQLERAAMQSGLDGAGDFKLSCSEYERLARSAGFEVDRERIGPIDRDDIGGVFVYRLRLPA
jgi:predicted O-methyltransferase YrrM